MQAADIMNKPVISVAPEMTVKELASVLLEKRISAVPVIGADGALLGIVSEGDLVRRVETETEPSSSWWLDLFTTTDTLQERFIKSHGRRVADVMTKNPVTVAPDAALSEIAALLEAHRIKRVPVVADGAVVGIVSRANLLHGLAVSEAPSVPCSTDDRTLREAVQQAISDGAALGGSFVNVIVRDGAVQLVGSVNTDREEHAVLVAAESVPGVTSVDNKLGRVPVWAYGY